MPGSIDEWAPTCSLSNPILSSVTSFWRYTSPVGMAFWALRTYTTRTQGCTRIVRTTDTHLYGFQPIPCTIRHESGVAMHIMDANDMDWYLWGTKDVDHGPRGPASKVGRAVRAHAISLRANTYIHHTQKRPEHISLDKMDQETDICSVSPGVVAGPCEGGLDVRHLGRPMWDGRRRAGCRPPAAGAPGAGSACC